MSDELNRRSHSVLRSALDVEPAERQAFIDSACADNPTLRRKVQSLIDALEDTHGFLEVPALEVGKSPVEDAPMVTGSIGGYRIVRVLGAGGMATVYEAIQDRLHRRVALKVMKQCLGQTTALQRFEFETEVLARLRHPGIAQIFEAGTHQDGAAGSTPFFAMEYIEKARTITAYGRERFLDARSRLEMFVVVCEAVQHGHQNGVIHRDLKPGNILVDSDGRPKVIDFGVARSSESRRPFETQYTEMGQLIGTLNYMSPEQCVGGGAIDVRTDVYSLGVVLYELLCGAPPHDLSTLPIPEALRVVLQDTPRRPSSVNAAFRGDIDAIVMKAIEKEPARRYQTASEFAADVKRCLESQPIQARPATTIYQLRKFAQRNRGLVGGAAAVVLTLIVGIAATARQAYLADLARQEAMEQRFSAESRLERALEAELAAERARAMEEEQRILAEQREKELRQVAEYQAAQLRGIDVAQMGARLREDLVERTRHSLAQRQQSDPERSSQDLEELKRILGGVNFTDVALTALDVNLFERALAEIDQRFADQPLVRAKLLQSLASTMDELGLMSRSVSTMEAALKLRQQELGEDHVETLEAQHVLGSLLINQGKHDEAEAYYLAVLEGRRRVLGQDHPDTIRTIGSMGALLVQQGKLAEAEPYFRAALEGHQRTRGEAHPETLRAISNMGTLLQDQGKFAEAEPYCREALAKRRAILGNDHPSTLISIDSMGSLYRAQGRLDEAEACYHEALEGRRRVHGDEHPQTLRSINNMAAHLSTQGRITEAEPFFLEVLEVRRRVLGNDHPDTLRSIGNMGWILQRQGRLDEAEVYQREVLEARRRLLGNDHFSTLLSVDSMGSLLHAKGDLVAAEELFREAVDGNRRALGDDHPDTLHTISHLSAVLRDLGEPEEAEALGREAIERSRRVRAEGHWDTAAFLAQHSRTLVLMLRFKDAEAALLEAHELYERVLGVDHESTERTKLQLVDLYESWRQAEPEECREGAADQWRSRLAHRSQAPVD